MERINHTPEELAALNRGQLLEIYCQLAVTAGLGLPRDYILRSEPKSSIIDFILEIEGFCSQDTQPIVTIDPNELALEDTHPSQAVILSRIDTQTIPPVKQ